MGIKNPAAFLSLPENRDRESLQNLSPSAGEIFQVVEGLVQKYEDPLGDGEAHTSLTPALGR